MKRFPRTLPAQRIAFRSPIPTQVVSSGEYNPPPQTAQQRQVAGLIKELAEEQAAKLKLDRRRFLASSAGMAMAFLAMNKVFGPIFAVSEAEAKDLEVAAERAKALSGQFIFDVQMGADHVVWGTDSVFWGSQQWQIEAMRRIEIPDDMLKKNRWQPLGGPDSPTKRAIFGLNSARLYRYNMGQAHGPAFGADKLVAIQQEYRRQGFEPSNAYYGYIAKTQTQST